MNTASAGGRILGCAFYERNRIIVHRKHTSYVADTTEEAIDDFLPRLRRRVYGDRQGARLAADFPSAFNALRSPQGALLVGNAQEVAAKIVRQSNALGGISRINFQMSVAALPNAKLMQAIDLLGKQVAPALRAELAVQPAV